MDYFTHLMEGFDLVGSSSDLVNRGFSRAEGSVQASAGKFGDNAFAITGGTSNVLGFSVTGIRSVSLALWFRHGGALVDDQYILSVEGLNTVQGSPDGPNDILTLRAHSDGALEFTGRSIDSTFPVKSAVGRLTGGAWHHIELLVDFMEASTIYIDGLPVLTAVTGIDDDPSTPFLDDFSVAFYGGSSNTTYYDDIVARVSAYTPPELLEEHHIHTLLPSGDTGQADWAGSYTDVNEPFGSSDGDASYIQSETNNDYSLFNSQTMPVVSTAIHGLQITAEGKKTGVAPKALSSIFIGSGTIRQQEGVMALNNSYTTKLTRFGGTSNGFFGAGDLCSLQIGVILSE